LEQEVYRIDRVPGVPKWYDALYLECLDKDPSNRPELNYVQDTMKSKSANPYAVRDGYDTSLTDIDPNYLRPVGAATDCSGINLKILLIDSYLYLVLFAKGKIVMVLVSQSLQPLRRSIGRSIQSSGYPLGRH
jgi:hypothetical protein